MRSPAVLRVLVQLDYFVPGFSHSDPTFPQKGKKKSLDGNHLEIIRSYQAFHLCPGLNTVTKIC